MSTTTADLFLPTNAGHPASGKGGKGDGKASKDGGVGEFVKRTYPLPVSAVKGR